MGKKILVLYGIICIITCGCSIGHIFTSFDDEYVSGETHMVLYFKESEGPLLAPETRTVSMSGGRVEEVILQELIKGPQTPGLVEVLPPETKLLSLGVRGRIANINIRAGKDSSSLLNRDSINSIVNSLTELPHITGVNIYIEGKKFGNGFMRQRDSIKRENLSPSQVMERQMKLEKSGDWLNAYMLMSDSEESKGRKSYDEYVKELQEVKKEGLLNADFEVGEYKIDPVNKNLSRVKVNFIITNPDGSIYKSPDAFFPCVKIDGYWKVDWLTDQDALKQ